MESMLEVKAVTKLYRNGRGIRNISFSLARGDIFGLIGPNGAGKTTLLKIITGLIRPERGEVRIFGCSLAEHFEQAMARVGCVIETASAYHGLTGYDNLKLAARLYPDIPKGRIDKVLEEAGLAPYRRERVSGYSLGMKQRLALASALLSDPQLVILDEPANGLDIEGMAGIRDTIARLAKEQGKTFLVSSHLIHDLGMIAGRIGVMKEGHLIRLAGIDELVRDGVTLEQAVLAEIQSAKEANADV